MDNVYLLLKIVASHIHALIIYQDYAPPRPGFVWCRVALGIYHNDVSIIT